MEDIAKIVTIPHLSLLGESLDCHGKILRVGMPRVFNDAGEGGVGDPNGFGTEGLLTIVEGERVCAYKDWVVVGRGSREVEDVCFFTEEFPVRVGKNSIKSLHNKPVSLLFVQVKRGPLYP